MDTVEINWSDLVGHKAQAEELRTLWQEGRLPHALLFTGAAGIGKKLCGQILAKMILCGQEEAPCGQCENCRSFAAAAHPDYYELIPEVRGKSTRIIRIEAIREMQTVVSRSAIRAGQRVVLIDDADTMNEAAANSLLKTLEEPEGKVTFILIAQDRSRLLPTIVSRCMPLSFGSLSPAELKEELIRRQIPAPEAEKLANLADGSLGQALKLSTHDGLRLREAAFAFLAGLPAFTLDRLWAEAAAKGEWDREQLTDWLRHISMLLRDMLLLYDDGASTLLYNSDLRGKLEELLPDFSPGRLFAMHRQTCELLRRLQANVNLRLQLEGYFIRLMDSRQG